MCFARIKLFEAFPSPRKHRKPGSKSRPRVSWMQIRLRGFIGGCGRLRHSRGVAGFAGLGCGLVEQHLLAVDFLLELVARDAGYVFVPALQREAGFLVIEE